MYTHTAVAIASYLLAIYWLLATPTTPANTSSTGREC